jgi:hypothetical protein
VSFFVEAFYIAGLFTLVLMKVTVLLTIVLWVPVTIGTIAIRPGVSGWRRAAGKRFIPALVIAMVLGGGAIAQAQIICTIPCPVWDISSILQNVAINLLKKTINEKLDDQQEVLFKMATRLTKLTPLKKYVVLMDDTPEWRIHDWFTGANLYSNDFLQAMTYGDPSGAGYATVSGPRQVPDEPKFLALPGDTQQALGADLAVLDLADSTIARGTHETGALRFNGREEARTIADLQDAVTDDSDEESVTAVMDKLAAAGTIESRDKQAKLQFLSALLEQLTVDSMRDRNNDTANMNMVLSALEDDGAAGRSTVAGAASVLANWQLP